MINVSQSFHRTSANAIDDTLTLTKAQMLAINDNLMPSKYLTICQEDGKIYLYDKAATPSVETGKFSVFEGGESLPSGGTTGQLLAKKSSTDGDVEWKTVEGLDPIQVDELPEASVDELGKVYQYVGSHPIDIDYADDAVNNFVGEGTNYYYSIANNDIRLIGQTTGSGLVKCNKPMVNRGTLTINKTYNGVGTNIFTYKTRLGTTVGGNDVYESADWGRASSVETIDLSQFDEEELYLSFIVNVTQINSGQVSVYTITSVHHEAEDAHTKGFFYECKSVEESGTTTYYWEAIPTQEGAVETINFADFNALSEDEKNNGTLYCIPDAEIVTDFTVMGNRFDKANIYTEDERMIGSYLGKPLYQKVVIDATCTVTDLERVIKWCPVYKTSKNWYGGAYYKDSTDAVWLTQSNNVLTLIANGNDSLSSMDGFIVQYTKTNDATVNIGTGNDYSTEEQIIGTWIDGKPLYQKTFTGTATGKSGDLWNNITIDWDANTNITRYIEGTFFVPGTNGGSGEIESPFIKTNTLGVNQRWTGGSITYTYYVTVQYTKTTD